MRRWVPIQLALYWFILALVSGCTALIAPYDQKAYENSTSLKAVTLAVMGKATNPYSKHVADVEKLQVELDKAYYYAKGIPSNRESALMWKKLADPNGDLIGLYMRKWKGNGTLKLFFIEEAKGQVADAFDAITCLEANKKEATKCRKLGE